MLTIQSPKLFSFEYFAICGAGGAFCCSLTHLAVTPIDVVKCNIQANPVLFPNTFGGFRSIISGSAAHLGHKKGVAGLLKGWHPTLLGYGMQGACKFGGYEYFKYLAARFMGEKNYTKYRDLVYLASAATAEFIGDIFLCPFEAVKVKMQLDPRFATGLFDGFPKFIAAEGASALFSGLVPLWGRQIPYTVIKFMVFERICEFIYDRLPVPKHQLSKASQFGVVFVAGYVGGVFCAVGSQPADTILSVLIKQNQKMQDKSTIQKLSIVYKQIGFGGLFAGLLPRTFMIGSIAAAQWIIYSYFKSIFGLEVPGSQIQKK